MQWVEAALWLEGPTQDGTINQLLTVCVIPLALLVEAWGPLFGSAFVLPVSRRPLSFFLLLFLGLAMVVAARIIYQPIYTQITPQGHLNWWASCNPPSYTPWAYGLWAVVIGAPFLLWWRPLWHSLLIVSWGWLWAVVGFFMTDSAASYWCFYVSFYAAFLLTYAFMVRDEPKPADPTWQPGP